MARRVFFSFHYRRDLWRANVVRNSGAIEGIAAAGFHDASIWEEATRQGSKAVEELVDRGLKETSVTVVLIGAKTAERQYVSYEIEKSLALGRGLLGIHINEIKDQSGLVDPQGTIPDALRKAGAPIYKWEYGKLGQWIESAFRVVNPES
jgi:MTH538 TIR-like domain (DUF1863)